MDAEATAVLKISKYSTEVSDEEKEFHISSS